MKCICSCAYVVISYHGYVMIDYGTRGSFRSKNKMDDTSGTSPACWMIKSLVKKKLKRPKVKL